MSHKVLILGGYGTFGSRIARRLAASDGIHVSVGGRSASQAKDFAASLTPNAVGMQVDINDITQLRSKLRENNIDTVIHTAGPFQQANYDVARCIIESNCNYIDLADARDYICNFHNLNDIAIRHNVVAVTGASSVPGISSALVDHIKPSFASIEAIDMGISPGNQTPRGVATVAAILSYAGKPITVTRNNAQAVITGWSDTSPMTYPPPIGRRYISNCDIADLELFPSYYNCPTVTFKAGLELPILQYATVAMAKLVSVGVISNLATYARPLKELSEYFKYFGSTAGAMHVRVRGVDANGNRMVHRVYLCAASRNNTTLANTSEAVAGPEIPCTPAVILAQMLATGKTLRAGAYPCLSLFKAEHVMESLAHVNVWLSYSDSYYLGH